MHLHMRTIKLGEMIFLSAFIASSSMPSSLVNALVEGILKDPLSSEVKSKCRTRVPVTVLNQLGKRALYHQITWF